MAENLNSRLETFCDGVSAIAITLLILEIKTPVADEMAIPTRRQAISAFWLYSSCTILAFWFPLVISLVLTLTYLVWLALGATYRETRA